MGTDIHWVVERLHSDGRWDAVDSKRLFFRVFDGPSTNFDALFADPRYNLGNRCYETFSFLSGLRGDDEDRCNVLAEEGLPFDASEMTRDSLDLDSDLHSHGHFTWARFKAIAEQPNRDILETPQEVDLARRYLRHLEDRYIPLLASSRPQIMFGREYDPDENVHFPDMKAASAHQLISYQRRARDLLPIGPDTLRIIIAYDN